MTAILATTIGDVLDNYADVIEGGSSYAGGTSYSGVAGTQSHGELADETITAGSGTTTTSIVVSTDYGADRFVSSAAPPWFLLGATGEAANVGAARKISDVSSSAITVAAFPTTPAENDTFDLREGFRRAPDSWDIEATGEANEAFDRFFQLSAWPMARLGYYGNTTEMYEAEFELRLSFVKRSRSRKVLASAMENLLYIRSYLTDPGNRDGTYTQILECSGAKPDRDEDDKRLVLTDTYRLVFMVGADKL